MNEKAIIAMSGGVDSAVAALIMKERGYDCIGVTMKLFEGSDSKCCSLDDVEDAKSVARYLGIPHYVFNFKPRFKEAVIDRFVYAYENGMTPNPCIDCNRFLKFDELYRRARELGCGYVVTGHYAVTDRDRETGRYILKKAAYADKDQSYVLYSMTQEQLAHTLFPLGGMSKPDVRRLAEENGFINARKRDSQDICFVPDGRYADFIESYTGKMYPEGDFTDIEGNVIGRHKGIIRYTVGQRKGLGLAMKEPVYVRSVDPESNTVTVARDSELYSKRLEAKDINIITSERIEGTKRLKARIRYRHKEQWASVTQTDGDTLLVEFDEPQRAITKGQSVVLYDGDIVVGGGTIFSAQ